MCTTQSLAFRFEIGCVSMLTQANIFLSLTKAKENVGKFAGFVEGSLKHAEEMSEKIM